MTDQVLKFDEAVFVFETVMRVRSTEIGVGQYLTLEALTALLAEARARFLYSKGIKEINSDYQGLMVNSLQIDIVSRVRARETLLCEVGVEQLSDNNGDMAFKVTRMYDGSLVATARKGFIQYDYRSNEPTSFSINIKEALDQKPLEL